MSRAATACGAAASKSTATTTFFSAIFFASAASGTVVMPVTMKPFFALSSMSSSSRAGGLTNWSTTPALSNALSAALPRSVTPFCPNQVPSPLPTTCTRPDAQHLAATSIIASLPPKADTSRLIAEPRALLRRRLDHVRARS